MPTLHHLYQHLKQYGAKHQSLYILSLMLFFFTIYDGIISFVTPLVITETKISETLMGIIIGFSSLAGAFFDFLLCRFLKNTHYRRLFFLMFAITLVYPLILWQSKSIFLFLIAMALWGLYYDFYHLGCFDFVGRKTNENEHVSSFGVIQVFASLGYLIAPLIAGLLIGELVNFKPFLMAWIFLVIAVLFYLVLLVKSKKDMSQSTKKCLIKPLGFIKEFRLWLKIGRLILPVLFLVLILNIIDAAFWTIGPLIAESLPGLEKFGGLFLLTYQLPSLLVGWFVGRITAKKGKKKTAFISLLIGSLFFCSFFMIQGTLILLIINFLASFFIAMAWPAINGAFADYIGETSKVKKEIETLQDYFTNLGYVIGPILAGFLGEHVGHAKTFTILGILGVCLALILLRFTPKEINIRVRAEGRRS
jgi:MFS family permease